MSISNTAPVQNGVYADEAIRHRSNLIGIGHWPIHKQVAAFYFIIRCLDLREKYQHEWYRNHVSISRDDFRHFFSKEEIEFLKAKIFATPNQNYSAEKGVTKAYRLRKEVVNTLDNAEFLPRRNRQMKLVNAAGKSVGKLRRPLKGSAKSADSLGSIPAYCPINMDSIGQAQQLISHYLLHLAGKRNFPTTHAGFIGEVRNQYLAEKSWEDIRRYLSTTLRQLNGITDLSNGSIKRGCLPQQFAQSNSGRFYGIGRAPSVSLQNCTRLTRRIALTGYYSIDIESCHHSILFQIAKRHGWECSHLEHYVSNKSLVRQDLASYLGITEQAAKAALIAMIYGAGRCTFDGAFNNLFGSSEKVKKAFDNHRFQSLYDELQALFNLLIDKYTEDYQIKNSLGKVAYLPQDKGSLVAHILQGFEAQALIAALKVHKSAVVPLHDGWICSEPESLVSAATAIYEETGFRLKLTSEEYEFPA